MYGMLFPFLLVLDVLVCCVRIITSACRIRQLYWFIYLFVVFALYIKRNSSVIGLMNTLHTSPLIVDNDPFLVLFICGVVSFIALMGLSPPSAL